MALIKCKNCGHLISDKAVKCPKCGAENTVTKNETTDEKKVTPQTDDSVNSPKQEKADISKRYKKPALILGAFICLLAVIGVGIGYYKHEQTQDKLQEQIEKQQRAIDEAAALNALRLDSIRRDSLHRDSIRQDSINFRNFSTPDLAFFELHGRVKSVHYYDDRDFVSGYFFTPVEQVFISNCNEFEFDKEGNLINKKELFKLSEPDGEFLFRWVYNGNGFPTAGIFSEKSGDKQSWDYYNNGQLKKRYESGGAWHYSYFYTYDANNSLIRIKSIHDTPISDSATDVTVIITESDKWGNWTKRNRVENTIEKQPRDFYQCGYNYKIVKDEYGNSYYKIEETTTERRTITYYDEE